MANELENRIKLLAEALGVEVKAIYALIAGLNEGDIGVATDYDSFDIWTGNTFAHVLTKLANNQDDNAYKSTANIVKLGIAYEALSLVVSNTQRNFNDAIIQYVDANAGGGSNPTFYKQWGGRAYIYSDTSNWITLTNYYGEMYNNITRQRTTANAFVDSHTQGLFKALDGNYKVLNIEIGWTSSNITAALDITFNFRKFSRTVNSSTITNDAEVALATRTFSNTSQYFFTFSALEITDEIIEHGKELAIALKTTNTSGDTRYLNNLWIRLIVKKQ